MQTPAPAVPKPRAIHVRGPSAVGRDGDVVLLRLWAGDAFYPEAVELSEAQAEVMTGPNFAGRARSDSGGVRL